MATKKQVYIDLHSLAREPSILKMAISDRSDGKTTEAQTLAVETFDASGKSAVFARRYGTEMGAEFFDEFEKNLHVHPSLLDGRDYDFISPSKKRLGAMLLQPRDSDQKRLAVTFVPLTKAGRLKSALGYSTHKNVFIDEYLPLDARYLKDEAGLILELYKTIDRNHFDNYVMITGNKITRYNPIFQYFGITSWKRGINTYKNGALSLLVYSNKGNVETCENSPFGDLVRGTKYEAYNAGEFLRNFNELIKKAHSRICVLYVAHRGRTYGLYQSEDAVVFDYARQNGMPAPCVCIEPQPPDVQAVWLHANDNAKALLQAYKYANRLFFADEIILNELSNVYTAV